MMTFSVCVCEDNTVLDAQVRVTLGCRPKSVFWRCIVLPDEYGILSYVLRLAKLLQSKFVFYCVTY